MTSLLPGDILPSEAAGETGAATGEEAVLAVGRLAVQLVAAQVLEPWAEE